MIGAAIRHGARPVAELPGDEDAADSTHLHSRKSLVESRNHAAQAHRKAGRLGLGCLGLAIVAHHRLAIVAHHRGGMLIPRIEYDAVRGAPAGVLHLVHLEGLGFRSGTDLDILNPKSEQGFLDRQIRLFPGRVLDDACDRTGAWRGGLRGGGRFGGRSGRLGGSLSGCGHGSHQTKD